MSRAVVVNRDDSCLEDVVEKGYSHDIFCRD